MATVSTFNLEVKRVRTYLKAIFSKAEVLVVELYQIVKRGKEGIGSCSIIFFYLAETAFSLNMLKLLDNVHTKHYRVGLPCFSDSESLAGAYSKPLAAVTEHFKLPSFPTLSDSS